MLRDIFHEKRTQYIIFGVFIISVLCGGIYCNLLDNTEFTAINDYFTAYVKNNINTEAILKKALINNTLLGLFVMICGFFKVGVIFAPMAAAKEGFSTAFCVASLSRCFGFNGVIIGSASMLHMLFLLPVLILSSALSVNICRIFAQSEKKFKIFFVFFQIIVISIFCGSAFFQAYVNTIFMKFIFTKITI